MERHMYNMAPISGTGYDPLLRYFEPMKTGEVTEGSRLTMQQYYLLKQIYQRSFMGISAENLAAGCRVLDAGTATGLWLAEMERDFPASKISHTVSLWPDTQIINSSSKVSMVESHSLGRLPFQDGNFDYVHEQTQLFVTSQDHWPIAISEFARVLKPGGYVDISELDPYPINPPTPLVAGFVTRLLTTMTSTGYDLRGASRIAEFVEATGQFTDIQLVRRTVPYGWDGKLGELWAIHLHEGYISLRTAFGFAMNVNSAVPSESEWLRFLEIYMEDCRIAYRVTARKKNIY
ncbi:hypothetical protein BJ742DRAFT_171411 [Cladochytrium replicatum]|nr:hypothetical protein BJ742DRAFT_171411 [Cladochytrium replicatum]